MVLIPFLAEAKGQDPKPPLFDLHSADGKTGTGPLEQVREDWSVSLGGAKPFSGPGSEVISLRRHHTPLPPAPRNEHVVLANGDQLTGTVLELTEERIRFRAQSLAATLGERGQRAPGGSRLNDPTEIGKDIALPLTSLTVLWFADPGADDAEEFQRHLLIERRRRDVLWLRNGDRIEGTLTGLNHDTIRLQGENRKEIKVERARVTALALSTDLARVQRPKGTYARLILNDGGRLSLLSARTNDHQFIGKTLFGATLQIPVDEIVALDLLQGCAVYLSDLKPSRYEYTPYLGVHWPYVRDGSVTGHPLRLGDSIFDKGIGMHSESRLTYELGGRYQWFEAMVGLDERTGRQGSVELQVLVDGKAQESGVTPELTGTDRPRSLRIPVNQARELTLVVKFGRGGDVQDHVDWADARLILSH